MSFRDDLEKAEAALADKKVKSYTYKGKKYSLTELRDELIRDLKKLADAEDETKAKAEAAVSRDKLALRKAKEDLDFYERTLETNRRAFRKKRSGVTEADLDDLEAKLEAAELRVAELEKIAAPVVAPVAREPIPAAGSPEAVAAARLRLGENLGPIQGPPSPFLDADGKPIETETDRVIQTTETKPKRVTKAEVDVALASSGLADTPDNRKKVRADLQAGKKPQADWETLVAEQAGEYAYLLDPQYEGVPELLRKAVQQGYFKSDEGLKIFVRELKQTGYFLNTSKKQQSFDKMTPADKRVAIELEIGKIRAEYGEIQFDQSALEEVAGVAARNGASPAELGRLVYRAAFKRGSVAPDFTAPVAAKTALGGQDADRIRAIYRAYGQRADDEMISRILAGDSDPASGVVMTEDMLRTNLRDIAKVSYSPFADLLDRGVSVETIFAPYQSIAASVLEKPRDQISLLTNDGVPTDFASALMGDKPMSLNDWVSELKRNPKYNYQFTSAANAEVSSMVSTLEKAFGFRQ